MAFVFRGLPPTTPLSELEEFHPSYRWTWPPGCPLLTSLPANLKDSPGFVHADTPGFRRRFGDLHWAKWPFAQEWKIHLQRGQEIGTNAEIFVGLIVDFSLVTGTLTQQMDALPAIRSCCPITGGESQRDSAYDFRRMVEEAAEKWIEHVFSQDPSRPEAVHALLKHPNSSVQRAGLEVLGKLTRRGADGADATIAECHSWFTANPRDGVLAFNVMAKLAAGGDERFIDAVGQRLDSAQLLAPSLLREHQNNAPLVTTVCKRLEHTSKSVREAALAALKSLVSPDNPHAINEVCLRLSHSRAWTRQAALRALTYVARQGNLQAIQAVRPLLEDRAVKVVRPAADAALDSLEPQRRVARRN
eukprot:Skav205477  [mRNA]  locus=scaffold830:220919:221998:+ [translate_table: standard]